MNFTNINDPAGISALLEQLRSSQAWSNLQQAQPNHSAQDEPPQPTNEQLRVGGVAEESKPSVSSLLSQLSSSSTPVQDASLTLNSSPTHSVTLPSIPSRTVKDVRNYTFQQALPHLAQLSDDPSFVEAVLKLRQDQKCLEKQLREERQVLHEKQVEKIKIAVTKANMLGTGISEREANAMRQVFEEELTKFDRDRVIPIWDGLVARQQAALEKLGVPSMFVTEEGTERERQQRIIQVLEGIVGSGESDGT